MADYATNSNIAGTPQAISSSVKTLLQVAAATANLRRGKLYDAMFGTLGTPNDNSYAFDMVRQTTAGTGGGTATPNPLDPADSASGTVALANMTAEPTGTLSLFYLGMNQRASYRWVAAPGSELVWPATNLAGIGMRATSGSGTAIATAAFLFQEQ